MVSVCLYATKRCFEVSIPSKIDVTLALVVIEILFWHYICHWISIWHFFSLNSYLTFLVIELFCDLLCHWIVFDISCHCIAFSTTTEKGLFSTFRVIKMVVYTFVSPKKVHWHLSGAKKLSLTHLVSQRSSFSTSQEPKNGLFEIFLFLKLFLTLNCYLTIRESYHYIVIWHFCH